jgi:uncharacterized membrane protein YdfJ with MMPL/SSD domain
VTLLRRIALFPASRRGKWVMVAAWLVIAGFAGPIGGKLSSVVKNDQASYLPGNAGSTQVLTDVTRFPSGQTLPAVVVAERAAGITDADRAATFSALGLLPLVFVTEIGVLVAVGVLIDTLVVRSILVPALVIDIGDGVWWPGRLSRRQGPPAMPETLVVRSATDSPVGPRARS